MHICSLALNLEQSFIYLFIYLFKHNFFYYYLLSRKNSDLELTTIEFIKKVYLKIN